MSTKADDSILLDGKEIKISDLGDEAKMQIESLRFVDMRLQQLESELAVADTARIGYKNALQSEVLKIKSEE